MVALAQSRGHEIWTELSTSEKVVVCGKRRGSDHVERSEWTLARAQRAGYTSNTKYGSNGQEMLYAKAAAEIARKVAADVLAGVPASVEDLELEDQAVASVTTIQRGTGTTTRARRASSPAPVADEPPLDADGPAPLGEVAAEPQSGAESGEGSRFNSEPASDTPATDDDTISDPQLKLLQALFRGAGITESAERHAYESRIVGREITSSNQLSIAEASEVIESLKSGGTP
jgi:hypothetical protein